MDRKHQEDSDKNEENKVKIDRLEGNRGTILEQSNHGSEEEKD